MSRPHVIILAALGGGLAWLGIQADFAAGIPVDAARQHGRPAAQPAPPYSDEDRRLRIACNHHIQRHQASVTRLFSVAKAGILELRQAEDEARLATLRALLGDPRPPVTAGQPVAAQWTGARTPVDVLTQAAIAAIHCLQSIVDDQRSPAEQRALADSLLKALRDEYLQ
jgi:hypothetical protein